LERYDCFHGANLRYIKSSKSAHIALSLNEAPNGKPKYFKGKSPVPQPNKPANRPTLPKGLTGIKADLEKLTFNSATASKQKIKAPM
jgi:hypothetical protein